MSAASPSPGREPAFTTRPTLTGTFGMAAGTHWLATGTAQSVLERDGTAVDAAVAAAFVLHLAEPHLNGPGGDMVTLVQPAGADRPLVLNGQGPAPRGATIEHFRAEGLDRVPGAGALAAAVPGAVDAWLWLLERHGTWELADVLEHAIGLAETGIPVSPGLHNAIARVAGLFAEHWPSSARRWLVDGAAPAVGSHVTNPEWGAVLRALVAAGAGAGDRGARIAAARSHWKRVVLARAAEFAAVPHRHSTGADHAGVLTAADVLGFEPSLEPAVAGRFRDLVVYKAGVWNAGPALLEMLGILDRFDDAELDLTDAAGIHRTVEAIKLAMADRDGFVGEAAPAADGVVGDLLDDGYLDHRAALVGALASLDHRPGRPGGRVPYLPPLLTPEEFGDPSLTGSAGEPTVRRAEYTPALAGEVRGDTVHLDVVDRHGTIVSATPSGGWLQSSPTVPGLGFCLGTRLQMAWLDERSPSRLAPGLRPRTTLTPTIVHRGTETTALGTPGGDQQDQWQLQYLLRTVCGGLSPQAAIDAPMFTSGSFPSSFWPRTWRPGELVLEGRTDPGVLRELEKRGHRVVVTDDWVLGRLSMVSRDAADGRMRAAANPRGATGYATGR